MVVQYTCLQAGFFTSSFSWTKYFREGLKQYSIINNRYLMLFPSVNQSNESIIKHILLIFLTAESKYRINFFFQLCKAVHANNILPVLTTSTTTTTTEQTTTKQGLVEFTPPPFFRRKKRNSHNMIQLKADCCKGDLCNSFNLHDPNCTN